MIAHPLVTLLGFGTAALLAAASSVAAQSPFHGNRPSFKEGTHAFRRILYDCEFQPLADLNQLKDPAQTLVVILGDPSPLTYLETHQGNVKNYWENGGALLFATDKQTGPVLNQNFGVTVTGKKLFLSQTENAFQKLPHCPFIEAVPGKEPALFAPVALPGSKPMPAVAANLPSYLELNKFVSPPQGLEDLAVLPWGCTSEEKIPLLPNPLFALGGELGRGRVLIMADHSIFINDMLLRPDNGNLAFALRCVQWLRDGPQGRRKQILFYEEGNLRTDLNVPLKDIPLPPFPPLGVLVPLMDQTLHGLEQENTLNELLLHFVGGKENFWKGLILVLSTLLALWGLIRLGLFRHKVDGSGPSLDRLLGKQKVDGPLLEQRYQELLRQGNLWEAAHTLARNLFASAEVNQVSGSPFNGKPPRVIVSGGWWRRWWWSRRVNYLWLLAHASLPMRVSRGRFAALVAEIRQVQDALAVGALQLVPQLPPPPPADHKTGF